MTQTQPSQTSLRLTNVQTIPLRVREALDEVAARLAVIVYVGAECFRIMIEHGELDFAAWRRHVDERLEDQGIMVSEDEIKWLQRSLAYEPGLKAENTKAREQLKSRLHTEPVLPVGATVALFMNRSNITEDRHVLHAEDVGTPTAWATLEAPLHFTCTRGDTFQLRESKVLIRIAASSIAGRLGNPKQEAERFLLETPEDFSIKADWIQLKYPSLNKAFSGIFSRLHLGEGKQNTNRSIYYHAAWLTSTQNGAPEYQSLWGIRDSVRRHTWKCPDLGPGPHGSSQHAMPR